MLDISELKLQNSKQARQIKELEAQLEKIKKEQDKPGEEKKSSEEKESDDDSDEEDTRTIRIGFGRGSRPGLGGSGAPPRR